MSESSRFPRPLQRTRLYEQVAEQITAWISENDLKAGDRLPPERKLATSLGVSRATLSQALVALEVIGVVAVRHGDGTVLTDKPKVERITDAIRAHAERIPDVIEARDALETKIAALAATRRTQEDLDRIEGALRAMEEDIDGGGRGVHGDEHFHRAVTEAAHSPLLTQMMSEISELIRETRIESLSQPDRPKTSLAGHQKIADAIARGDGDGAAAAMHGHVLLVSDVALLREG